MPKVTRVSILTSSASSEKSEGHPLVWISLFSATGLLASLVAMLIGVQLAWY
jgi:hypothetical protein